MSTWAEMWQPLAVADGTTQHWRLGAVDLWVRRHESEWFLAMRSDPEATMTRPSIIDQEPPPVGLAWLRRIAPVAATSLQVVPRLPDRPVMTRPDHPLALLPGAECQFFISIPAFLSLQLPPLGQELHEFASETLSKSWSGSVTGGEPSYGLRTTAQRDPGDLRPTPHRVICPVHLRNQAGEPFSFTKLVLPTSAIGVYLGESRLWANRIEATYLGGGEWSRIQPDPAAPPFGQARELIGLARDSGSHQHLRPLLSELKHLTHR